jgi:formate-nitrite transporter family protein
MAKLTLPVGDRDHAQGSDEAPITLLEYGDYQCPYCGAAHPVVKRLQHNLGPRLRFVFRNFPLTSVHRHAYRAAQAAEAAARQGKFWEMHDWIFEHQDSLERDDLLDAARDLHLDVAIFKAHLPLPEISARINEDFHSGMRSGVNGTPTFFVNGARYNGRPTYEALLDALTAGIEGVRAR